MVYDVRFIPDENKPKRGMEGLGRHFLSALDTLCAEMR